MLAAGFHADLAAGKYQPCGFQAKAFAPVAVCHRTDVFGVLVGAHHAAFAADKSDSGHAAGSGFAQGVQYGLQQIRLHGAEQVRSRIHIDKHTVG